MMQIHTSLMIVVVLLAGCSREQLGNDQKKQANEAGPAKQAQEGFGRVPPLHEDAPLPVGNSIDWPPAP